MSDETILEAELPLDTAGLRLRRARESAGLSLKQISETTKIPERHLAAIEDGQYAILPARTYATGFARSYAKALGIDDAGIVEAVRGELALSEPEQPRRTIQTFEPGDPSRLPSSLLAWIAGIVALLVIAGGLAYWRGSSSAVDELPSLLPSETAAPAASQAAPVAAPTGGAVVFTATVPGVWVKFYDGQGVQLLQKELALGESYTVPAETPQVLLWTARPDALAITVGGQPVPKLSEQQRTMKDVPVTATAMLARQAAPTGSSLPPQQQQGSPVAAATVPQPVRERRNPAVVRQPAARSNTGAAAPIETPAAVPAEAVAAPVPAAT